MNCLLQGDEVDGPSNISCHCQRWNVAGENFCLDRRYKVVDFLGAGAYGVVCAAHDSVDESMVAIKKCKRIFQSRTLAKRTLREIRLLRLLKHENIIDVKTVLRPADVHTFSDMYIVLSYMETDLAQIIRSPQPLKDQHVQYFTYQLLRALDYIHKLNILHRDLKPRNLLVNGNCQLKLADFGLARLYNEQTSSRICAMTDYVTTRWYRAPEILVGWAKYSSAVDMWAVGCIVGELIGRLPMFPGSDSLRQLGLICQCLGKPSNEFLQGCRKESCRDYLAALPEKFQTNNFWTTHSGANPHALDLIAKLLQMNPAHRLSASSALRHDYMVDIASRTKSLARMKMENEGTEQSEFQSAFAFEEEKLSLDSLREQLVEEVIHFNPGQLSPATVAVNVLVPAGKPHTFAPTIPVLSEQEPMEHQKPLRHSSRGPPDICLKDNSDYSIESYLPHTDVLGSPKVSIDQGVDGGIVVAQQYNIRGNNRLSPCKAASSVSGKDDESQKPLPCTPAGLHRTKFRKRLFAGDRSHELAQHTVMRTYSESAIGCLFGSNTENKGIMAPASNQATKSFLKKFTEILPSCLARNKNSPSIRLSSSPRVTGVSSSPRVAGGRRYSRRRNPTSCGDQVQDSNKWSHQCVVS